MLELKINSYEDYILYINNQISSMSPFEIGFLLLWFIQRIDFIRRKFKSNNNAHCDDEIEKIGLYPTNYIELCWNILDSGNIYNFEIQVFKERMNSDFDFLTSSDTYCSAIFDILVALESFIDFFICKKISSSDIYWDFYLDNIERFFDECHEFDILKDEDFQSNKLRNEILKVMKLVNYINQNNLLSSKDKMLFWD